LLGKLLPIATLVITLPLGFWVNDGFLATSNSAVETFFRSLFISITSVIWVIYHFFVVSYWDDYPSLWKAWKAHRQSDNIVKTIHLAPDHNTFSVVTFKGKSYNFPLSQLSLDLTPRDYGVIY